MDLKPVIIDLLDELSIPYRWLDHEPVFTVAEAMQHIPEKRPVKNLLLIEKGTGRKVLVVMAGDVRLDMARLAGEMGTKKLQFADASTLETTLGVQPGSVSVFGLLHEGSKGVEVVLDESILPEAELGFHPNDNRATVFVPGAALEQIARAAGHEVRVLRLIRPERAGEHLPRQE